MRTTDMLEALLAFVGESGRVCPMPDRWSQLWEMLHDRRCVGAGWEPAHPLILAAWLDASVIVRMGWIEDHIRYAESHGVLREVDRYLRGLKVIGHTSETSDAADLITARCAVGRARCAPAERGHREQDDVTECSFR